MIDCGEGAQMQLRRSRLKFSPLESYLYFPSSWRSLLWTVRTDFYLRSVGTNGRLAYPFTQRTGRTVCSLTFFLFAKRWPIKSFFHEFETKEPTLIYDDRSVAVTTIPLRHRIPCCGFLFEEKQRPNHIIRDMVDFYKVPVYELNRIKNGADFVTPEGEVIPNHRLTRPSAPARKYAYCSDTIYRPEIVEQIKG